MRADLAESILSEADLRGANLAGANLRGTNLEWADLRGSDLDGADFMDANLRGAFYEELVFATQRCLMVASSLPSAQNNPFWQRIPQSELVSHTGKAVALLVQATSAWMPPDFAVRSAVTGTSDLVGVHNFHTFSPNSG